MISQTHSDNYSQLGYRPNRGQPNPLPQLTIKGRWLEALGFTTGQRIEVIPKAGQLIIRLATEG
ncbi:SymE family type I addiction module toxin [Lonsdalea quercina]|uniref:SymE family type I addiction module toxin n=1 Tax=Lonsdalea quercina TaxID=71657 RepID=UPI00397528D5